MSPPYLYSFLQKNTDFLAQAKYYYFSTDFLLKIFLDYNKRHFRFIDFDGTC